MNCLQCSRHIPNDQAVDVDGLFLCNRCAGEQVMNFSIEKEDNQLPHRQVVDKVISKSESPLARPMRQRSSRKEFSSAMRNRNRTPTSREESNSFAELRNRISRLHEPFPNKLLRFVEPKNQTKITCQACLEDQPAEKYGPVLAHQCDVKSRSVCNDCLYQMLKTSFENVFNDSANCPELSCKKKFEYETIKWILTTNGDTDLFSRYDRYVMIHTLEQMPEFMWCSNPKCQMGQLHEGGDNQNIATCRRCRHKTCFTHRTPWHEGLTCEQYDLEIDPSQKATAQWLNQNAKTCPKCTYQIEKNEGCDHMTCLKCRHEFCWACLADFDRIRKDGNHRHHPECKHYAEYKKA